MRKLLKLILSILFVFPFVACGGSDDDEKEETISTIYFKTFACNEEWSESNPAGYTVADYINITIYRKTENGFEEVSNIKSNSNGEYTYKTVNSVENLYYRAEKIIDEDKLYTNLDLQDFIIDGVFTTQKSINDYPAIQIPGYKAELGGIKLKDFNGDGILNDKDKSEDGYVPLNIANGETITEIIYLITRNYYAPGPGEPIG